MTETELLPARPAARTYVLEDVHVRSDGDGRTVESYFATFTRSEIRDQDGHYYEENARTAFAKTLADKGLNIPVFYNHARTLDGTPAAEFTLPIGVPVEIRADDRGMWNAVRYLDNPVADNVLGGIRGGAIKGMSYSGMYLKSAKTYPQGRSRGALPLITRQEIKLREFGPTPIPAFADAAILGTRNAELFLRALISATPEQRVSLLANVEGLEPLLQEPDTLSGTPSGAAATTGEPREHSARSVPMRVRTRAWRIEHGLLEV